MRRATLCIALTAAAAIGSAAEAHAARVAVEGTRIVVTAARGEANRVNVVKPQEGEIVVSDHGAPLEAGPGCRALSANDAACRRDASVHVLAGDGDDTVAIAGTNLTALGGAGDDVLTGGDVNDMLTGGPGRDELRGGAGADRLVDADVERRRGTPAGDVYDGGSGLDSLSYAGRLEPLAIDLGKPGPDGSAGEGEAITAVEELGGGLGDDRLTGDDSRNIINGGSGDDVVSGAGGNDELTGARGEDRLHGGAGNDVLTDGGELFAPDGLNLIACGPDLDRVTASYTARIGDDCEAIAAGQAHLQPQRPLRSVDEPVAFLQATHGCYLGCTTPVRLRMPRGRRGAGDPKPGTTLAKGLVPQREGERSEVRLSAAGRDLLTRRGSARVDVLAADTRFQITLRLEP